MKNYIKIGCCMALLCVVFASLGADFSHDDGSGLSAKPVEATKNIPVKTIKTQALLSENPDNLSDLEANSDYIVKGKILDGSEPTLIYATGTDDILMSYTTVTPLQVTHTYKGDFEEGETIDICEKYFKKEHNGEMRILHYGNYMPSTVGQEYIFFLKDCPKGTEWEGKYSVSSFERSRYPVLTQTRSSALIDEMSNEELNLDDGDATVYKELLKEVSDQYH